MFKSLRYVLKENFTNLYRIYSISKYELLADMRDSKLGLFWNFANPTIQVLTYWLVFGIIMTGRTEQDGVPIHMLAAWRNRCMVLYFSLYY